MASTSSRPPGKLVTLRERRIILQAYNYFEKEEEAGEPRFKINALLKKKTNESTRYSYNVIRAVRQVKDIKQVDDDGAMLMFEEHYHDSMNAEAYKSWFEKRLCPTWSQIL